ncbi:bifunctional UDP-N-acetylmuramoyl-tripeptide:D-alanyl-D-alanine ligase/alanine racemase [Terrimonas pollutisoli]|uniref:bifunctional UDP-N-acetylmuramoyl-tripeptide:D-alanyl-D-alanine ligase/alanine racemase n=1 Tax=Terrimonas pollutisoli TaxID=3034147 RepID=UPI0023ED1998|nr:bifunctional UDP-N-acetylmuramoyl-tripeptide:D-alanyl-D-alanine ligase/alanine racemase [Terrimonas sp. H1YJ31]
MKYSLAHIAGILGANAVVADTIIEQLLLDSRKVYSPATSLFFALKGPRRDGHQFIPDLYKKGLRSFVVSEQSELANYPAANFLVVPDTLAALQQLAIHHRKRFDIPVIGITGSNGKTIVKEWLCQLLHQDYHIVRNPKSYNSQIGVPLSVWQMEEQHTLGIFEAGISLPGEMESLEKIIQPTIGILTNIGEAHNEGFADKKQKLVEKLQLFRHCQLIIAREKDVENEKALISSFETNPRLLTWGFSTTCDLTVKHIEKEEAYTTITVCPGSSDISFVIPFTDDASIENAITCFFALLQLGVEQSVISNRMKQLQPVNMRLELKKGINHCIIINDSYSADIDSLEIALNFLDQQKSFSKKTVILSDVLQTARLDEQLYPYIIDRLKKHQVSRLIGIGEHMAETLRHVPADEGFIIELFSSTESYLQQFRSSQFREEVVLIKGARIFGFEQIVQLLEQKVHQTVLEINLNAIVHNVKAYQKNLKPSIKMMAMVKAFAYGSGGAEIAGILQYQNIDYLGVAYADEGVELRKAGIVLPIMVMNPEESAFDSIAGYNLEPDIYSFDLLHSFENFLLNEGIQRYPVHIEIETGMNRLGFAIDEITQLATHLGSTSLLKVQTVFSHLAASEDPQQDAFTSQQLDEYKHAVSQLKEKISYPFLQHISNSAGIFRRPELHLDMVRLGIGMYGVDSAVDHQSLLQPVATLKTTIAQLKHLRKGESVGYNRRGIVQRDSVIATVRIGYADGYSRKLGNGNGKMLVKGKLVPVIGSICMDMTMIDVTGISPIQEGDEVIIFGKELPVQHLAEWAGTIPYEIMTGISQRVKRVYYEE